MNKNNNSPVGTITLFPGNDIPPGWKLCDGSTISRSEIPNTYDALGEVLGIDTKKHPSLYLPNILNRFLVGAGSDSSIREHGGPDRHVHQQDGVSMSKKVDWAGDHIHTYPNYSAKWLDQGGPNQNCIQVTGNVEQSTKFGEWGQHQHDATITAAGGTTGESPAISRPKYIGINFIIKVRQG